MATFFRWALGLFVSLGLGHWLTVQFHSFRTDRVRLRTKGLVHPSGQNTESLGDDILPAVTGLVERCFFTLAVAFDISGSVVAMIAWLGAKMAVNWNRQPSTTAKARAEAMTALQTGLVSMLFALLGGVICKG